MMQVWTSDSITLPLGASGMSPRRLVAVAVACSFFGASEAGADTVNVASPYGPTQVMSAISSAANGDTVLMPSNGGPFSWTGAVTLPGSKCLTLDLNGRDVVLSGASGTITVQANSSCMNRVTNGTVTKSGGGYADYRGPFQIRDTANGYPVRVDHITFRGTGLSLADGTYISMNGQGPGVMDHSTFLDMEWPAEFIHIDGWGGGNTSGWTSNVDKGGAGLFYFEDNTFTNSLSTGGGNNTWIQGYYGARMVIRFNTFNFVAFDSHGTPGSVGMRWWEIYNNAFNHLNSNDNNTYQLNLRAGSGVIFNNTGSSGSHSTRTGMCEEDSGYPASYQIGRGTNQSRDPAYYFGNTTLNLDVNGCDAPEQPGMVGFDRDVYSSIGATCTAGGACSSGVGSGTTLPTSCTAGVGFWKTNAGGDWNMADGGANDGALYTCASTNSWTQSYVPYTYPHPLVSGAMREAPSNFRLTSD